jgi:peptide/nickel transport system permease protein
MPSLPLAGFALILLACFLAPPFLPYGATDVAVAKPFSGPGTRHWFGTDDLGRDLLARVLAGGRISLGIAAGAAIIALAVGTAWGMAAAARSGWIDEVLMRLADSVMAIPQILFALVFVAAFPAGLLSLTIIIGFLLSPTTARMVRGAVIAELASDYAVAARACGLSRTRVVLTEALPNVVPQIGVQTTINIASAIILEATLSFVGLGIQPPDASWGSLLLQGYGKIYSSLWLVAVPAAWIVAAVWSLTATTDLFRSRADGAALR